MQKFLAAHTYKLSWPFIHQQVAIHWLKLTSSILCSIYWNHGAITPFHTQQPKHKVRLGSKRNVRGKTACGVSSLPLRLIVLY